MMNLINFPNLEIRSLKDMEENMKIFYQFKSNCFYTGPHLFRGHANHEWSIIPAIARTKKKPHELAAIEKEMVHEFISTMKSNGFGCYIREKYLNAQYLDEWLMLQQAQHYGLPTRLIDWTYKENIAMAFAVLDSSMDNYDGAVFLFLGQHESVLNHDSEYGYVDLNPYTIVKAGEFKIILPNTHLDEQMNNVIGERRMSKQGGKFIIQDYATSTLDLAENSQFEKMLFKFIIPSDSKTAIRNEFAQLGVNQDTLYHAKIDKIDYIVKILKDKYGV